MLNVKNIFYIMNRYTYFFIDKYFGCRYTTIISLIRSLYKNLFRKKGHYAGYQVYTPTH